MGTVRIIVLCEWTCRCSDRCLSAVIAVGSRAVPGDSELEESMFGDECDLNLKEQQVDVFVEHLSGTKFCCPECSLTLLCYENTPERQWRYPDSCQFKTLLHASVSRVDCPEHGVKQVQVPWAEKGSRCTKSL